MSYTRRNSHDLFGILFPAMATLLLMAFLIPVSAASPPELAARELTYPAITGDKLASVTWGDSACVAVGDDGLILHSPDGSLWTNAKINSLNPTHADWSEVRSGGGHFVAVGGDYADGTIASSSDGENWDIRMTGNANQFASVAYGDGQFVAVAGTDVFSSPDGTLWKKEADSPLFFCLAFGNGIWIGCGRDGKNYASDDLSSWRSNASFPNFTSNHFQSGITFGNGLFVVVGGYPGQSNTTSASVLKSSVDGASWSWGNSADSKHIWGVKSDCTYANGKFVAVGSQGQDLGFRDFYTSSDGEVWTRASVSFPHSIQGYLTGVAGAEGRPFVAVSTAGEILISTDAMEWEHVDPAKREYMLELGYAESLYVAIAGRAGYFGGPIGTGILVTSTDARQWIPVDPDPEDCPRSFAHGNGCWLVTGDNGLILRSADGSTWEDRSIAGTTNDLHLVTFHAGRFIAFSKYRDKIYHSQDGIVWEILDGPPVADIRAVSVFEGKLIGAGENGTILASMDGINWEKKNLPEKIYFTDVCVGKGRVILAGLDHVASSENGIDFSVTDMSDDPKSAPGRIVYSDGWFISDDLRLSRDGIHWQNAVLQGIPPRYGRVDSLLVVAGNLVTAETLEIRRTDFLPVKPEMVVLPGTGIDFLTIPGKKYRANHSTDLKNWTKPDSWQNGTGDYRIQPQTSFPDRLFWQIESVNSSQ